MLVAVEVEELVVDLKQEFFHLLAGVVILVFVLAADAQVEWVLALLLVGSLLEARAFASESQFDDLEGVDLGVEATTALLDDSFHVGALAADYSSCHLELLFVVDLDVIPASILNVLHFFDLLIDGIDFEV